LLPTGTINSLFYTVVLVADDWSENDNDPSRDGGAPAAGSSNPGAGVLALRAQAFGPRGAHKTIDLTIARVDIAAANQGYTGQREQGEPNPRTAAPRVQSPGHALTAQTLTTTAGGIH
jgi:hypothetical protein